MSGSEVFSPWIERGGDGLIVNAECLAVSGATIKIEVFTRTESDSGPGSNADSAATPTNITLSSVRRSQAEWVSSFGESVSLYQLVRYKYTVTGTNAYDWILFRMLMPVWFDIENAS